MLKQAYGSKKIVVIGYQSTVGRVYLKSMITHISTFQQIYAIEVGKDQSRRSKFLADTFFTTEERVFLKEKVAYIPLNQVSKTLKDIKIDLLMNFFRPVDFSEQEKIINYHIFQTKEIIQQLTTCQINHCIHLSSIYFRQPGYLTEGEQKESNDFKFDVKNTDKKSFQMFLKDNFINQKQIWKWSLHFMEESYITISQKIDIIRVPFLGPTMKNNEGYTTKFNFFTYLIYQIGSGMVKNLNGINKNILDFIPADFAAYYAIVLGSKENNDKRYDVHNFSTSSRNPLSLRNFITYCTQAWSEYENKAIELKVQERKWERNLVNLRQKFPLQIRNRIGTIMDIKSWKIESQRAQNQLKLKQKAIDRYQYFLEHEWICESNKSIDTFNQLSTEDQSIFNFNVNSISWKSYIRLCVYSIKKYLLNQNVQNFRAENLDFLSKRNQSYFSDIVWALSQGKNADGFKSNQTKNFVLSSKSVKEAIRKLVEEKMMKLENTPSSYEKTEEEFTRIAEQMCTQMFSQYSMKSIRGFAWFMHKIFRTIYEKVVIDKNSIARLQNYNEKQLGPIIIIPTHRSYVDFIIMSYILFGYKIKCPHIAAAEDFLNMAVIHILLRKSGAFFIKRNQKKYKELYKAIMTEYISSLLLQNHYLEFFIEGTRSRVGKMLSPKYGILSIVAKNVIDGKIPDAQIMPVTINYQKVLEGTSFTYQLMGQAKIKESLSRLIKAVDVLKQNFGRIYIEICEPISIKKYFKEKSFKEQQYESILNSLGQKIVYDLTDNLVVTAPAILATIILMYRKGISDDTLSEKVTWLCQEISSRSIKIARSQSDSSISINNTLNLLEDVITKSKKDMFEVQVSFDQNSFIKLFHMTYYRNTLTHIFFEEAIVITALTSFGYQNIITKSTKRKDLYKQVIFLSKLFANQFYLKHDVSIESRFEQILTFLQKKYIIRVEDEFVIALAPNGNHFNLYWSLTWPIVESYWITCLYLFKLSKNTNPMPINKFLSEIQWFAQSLISQRIISHVEAISLDTIKNAVSVFTKMNFLKNIMYQYNGETVPSVKINIEEKEIKKLQEKIEQFLKSSYAKSVKGIFQSGQSSVNLDFPFLSKL